MTIIEGLRVQNYKVLQDLHLGRTWKDSKTPTLTPLVTIEGENGSGKSTLLDTFSFIADCLRLGVEGACDKRGGFNNLLAENPVGFYLLGLRDMQHIHLELHYREPENELPMIYFIEIGMNEKEKPFVYEEFLTDYNTNEVYLRFQPYKHGNVVYVNGKNQTIHLTCRNKLASSVLGELNQFPQITRLCDFIKSWRLNYFNPDAARNLPLSGPQKNLSIHGDNIANVVSFMELEHPERFYSIVDKIAGQIPEINEIHAEKTLDGRLLLQFKDRNTGGIFYAQQMSSGILKVLAYLLLLENQTPPPVLFIKEPENSLHPKLLEFLIKEFRRYVEEHKTVSQIFLTTHRPCLLKPTKTWTLEKQADGYSIAL